MAHEDPRASSCPSCSGTEARGLFSSNNGYDILRCSRCGLVFTGLHGVAPPSSLYPEFDQSDRMLPLLMRRGLSVFMRQREAIVRKVKSSGRLLDFGCGSGAFAHWMARAGYDVVGLEPFSLGESAAFERVLLIREPLESALPTLGRFDVVTLWQVLEHLPRPNEILGQLARLLTPGGVLIVSVPNFHSWQSRLFRGHWFHLDPPRHIIHFEAHTLENVLRQAGLQTIRRWDFLPEYGSSGWVQSALNRIVPHSNYLYEVVKDRGALKGLNLAEHVLYMTTSIGAAVPVAAISMPVELLASAIHQGATLTFAAKAREDPCGAG